MNRLTGVVAAVLCSWMVSGCITVPPEVVQLSQAATTDTKKLHDGYRKLVRDHFDTLRQIREQEFAEKIVGPYFERAITEGHVFDVLSGKLVYEQATDSFVAPDPAHASVQKLDTMNLWYRQVSADIQDLRKNAFADLDNLEKDVLNQLDAAFGSVVAADASVYAYLVSIQKIEGAQRDLLARVGQANLPDQLNDALAKASTQAATWTPRIDDANKQITDVKGRVQRLYGKQKGK